MNLRILLVEDNAVNLDVQTRMLQRLGHTVTPVTNGPEAVEIFPKDTYDLLLVDWQMPYMDGIETVKLIRQSVRESKPVFIVLSGHAMPGDREDLLSHGFDDYLAKPVRIMDFKEIIEKWFPRET
jgi:two-component system, sensor histidine kinase